jgi:DNA-binding response OmpR family regulator
MSSKARIVIVEDDNDISTMLSIYLGAQGYEVDVSPRGDDGVTLCQKVMPDLILLDIMLPGMDGYQVCRELRKSTRTKYIPIIFLTQRSERSDKIAGLELGADDYITKPFDIEELRLRVSTALRAHQRLNMNSPITNLPGGRLIEDELRELITKDGWAYLQIKIDNFEVFTDKYGHLVRDEALRFMAMLLNEVVYEFGTPNDLIGHLGDESFALITHARDITNLTDPLKHRFKEKVLALYDFSDREQEGVFMPDGSIKPFMKLKIGGVSGEVRFSDIYEIVASASERMGEF